MFESTLHELENRIKKAIWRPGDRLPTLPNLAAELNVSISTLREVLRILESRNLITIEQGRGTFVRTDIVSQDRGSLHFLKQLFEARTLLEPYLASMAATRGLREEIEEIAVAAQKHKTSVERRQDFTDEDIAFHLNIAKAAHNTVLLKMFQGLIEQLRVSRLYTNLIPGMIEKSLHYHLMIADALQNRDSERAMALMKSHMDDVSYELNHMEAAPTEVVK